MLFLTHWKLNEGLSPQQTNEIATQLMEDGMFPPEDVEVIRWDGTPDGWGIVVWEADSVQAINKGLNMWRAAADETAFFERTKTAPAAPVEETVPEQAAMLEQFD
ncbi:DUF3303 family protein [Halalkalicoccus ordinarius]|uniref:DUF3303 family protein n=1 Tax=Halalkalicoccus ordinarius TaxID=3116651 RepID=UPI00300F071B